MWEERDKLCEKLLNKKKQEPNNGEIVCRSRCHKGLHFRNGCWKHGIENRLRTPTCYINFRWNLRKIQGPEYSAAQKPFQEIKGAPRVSSKANNKASRKLKSVVPQVSQDGLEIEKRSCLWITALAMPVEFHPACEPRNVIRCHSWDCVMLYGPIDLKIERLSKCLGFNHINL